MSKYKKVKKALKNCLTVGNSCEGCRYSEVTDCTMAMLDDSMAVIRKLRKKAKKK